MPVTEEQLNELDRRFEEYRHNPERHLGRGQGKDPFGSALMEVVLLLSAERDLQEAYNWVERSPVGKQFFLQDVELRLEHLQKFPFIGRLYRGR